MTLKPGVQHCPTHQWPRIGVNRWWYLKPWVEPARSRVIGMSYNWSECYSSSYGPYVYQHHKDGLREQSWTEPQHLAKFHAFPAATEALAWSFRILMPGSRWPGLLEVKTLKWVRTHGDPWCMLFPVVLICYPIFGAAESSGKRPGTTSMPRSWPMSRWGPRKLGRDGWWIAGKKWWWFVSYIYIYSVICWTICGEFCM